MKPHDTATFQDTDSATAVLDSTGTGNGWDSQVVLFNDDVNTFDFVIAALMGVFGHTEPLAAAIALEAHNTGRAIAEVEPRPEAEKHAAALAELGLRASVESV